ncbi:MAG: 16S rRNA (cytosine(1402)-N(4))-methyltransferase RsmH [Bacilli bacterium]|nr:16S rRNA (cytosine(1402)-N(4))-methyltransferase RsmH [Bacilli bacterium]
MEPFKHIPVLLNETIYGLNIKEDGVYVDCTLGGGGHSSEILKNLGEAGHLYCFDQDDYAIKRGEAALKEVGNPNFTIIKSNFCNISEELKKYGITKIDGVIYDLGVSSFQFDMGDRGFSYNKDAKLDMRMDKNQYLTAYEIVNYYSYDDLKKIFYEYGEEKYSASIAKKICHAREKKLIETTLELADIVTSSIPARERRKAGHPAKQVFQALRIAVNDELNVLEKSLKSALGLLKKGGRCEVISFHSLEDRIVKQTFKNAVDVKIPKGLPIKDNDIVRKFKLINNKPITASSSELLANNRAHSAKLRIIEKL